MVHGSDGQVSPLEQGRIKKLIEEIYAQKEFFTNERLWEGFPPNKEIMLQKPYEVQVTWVNQVRYIYPELLGRIESQGGMRKCHGNG